tara:strand:+ start:2205 stop:2744 length:540 start_codon:yes stop_codon:yes gene_type:complete
MQQVSEDGKWMWNGTEWVPNEEESSAEPVAVQTPVVEQPAVAEIPVVTEPVAVEPAIAAAPVAAAAPMQEMGQMPMGGGGEWAIQTAEYGLFFTKLIGFFLKVLTLGFGFPWAKCMLLNKWAKNVRIDGRPIQFTGTPMGLFGIWVKICVLSIVTLTLYYWFAGYKQVAKYVDSHITWA